MQIFGTLESSWNYIDSFHDGMISGADQDAWVTNVTAGVRYYHTLPAISSKAPAGMFTAQAGMSASIGDRKGGLDLTMNGYTYRQESATRNRWGWNLGAGVELPVRSNVSLFGTAEAILRGDSDSINAQMGIRVGF